MKHLPAGGISFTVTSQAATDIAGVKEAHQVGGGKDWVKGRLVVGGHSIHFEIKSKNRRAYWSGRTVDISAPAPCLTVFAACAVRFFIPYLVRTSINAMK